MFVAVERAATGDGSGAGRRAASPPPPSSPHRPLSRAAPLEAIRRSRPACLRGSRGCRPLTIGASELLTIFL